MCSRLNRSKLNLLLYLYHAIYGKFHTLPKLLYMYFLHC